jgi:hypothetical protein
MIDVHFVVDGPRDFETIPALTGAILRINIRPVVKTWKSIDDYRVSGYARKFQFAISVAKDEDAAAIIAVVDRDSAPKRERRGKLVEGREKHRQKSVPFPTAIGEADPHADAWLLDDPVAIRQALSLDSTISIPTVHESDYPRTEVDKLIKKSANFTDGNKSEILGAIARQVDPSRCYHQNETGFKKFADDVTWEFRSLAPQCGPDCRCGDACAPSE